MTAPVGPRRLTQGTAERTEAPSDGRTGTVTAVTSRGIDVNVAGGSVEGIAHLSSYNPAVGDTVYLTRYQDSWIVQGRPVGPGTATDNASPGTGIGSTLLDGMALTKSGAVLATSATTGLAVPVPRYGVTFYHPLNHWVRIDVTYTYFSTVNGDVVQVQLVELATGIVTDQVEYPQNSGASWYVTNTFLVPPSFGGFRRSYGLRVVRAGGSGSCRLEDHATRRGLMLAYDAGDGAIIRTV